MKGDDFHWVAGFQGAGIVLSRMAVVFGGLVSVSLLSPRNTANLYPLICYSPFPNDSTIQEKGVVPTRIAPIHYLRTVGPTSNDVFSNTRLDMRLCENVIYYE